MMIWHRRIAEIFAKIGTKEIQDLPQSLVGDSGFCKVGSPPGLLSLRASYRSIAGGVEALHELIFEFMHYSSQNGDIGRRHCSVLRVER